MSTITNYKKIPKDVTTSDDLDFQFLKKTGIEYIESMGGALWSDLNEHDPGVTFLDMLCYAITDLGARIEMPIQDLLASEADPELKNQFYRAEEILPMCPVTALDYRKIFLDIDGIRNCWMISHEQLLHVNCQDSKLAYFPFDETFTQKAVPLQGLNCLLVDFEEEYDDGTPVVIDDVKLAIQEKYHKHRNLCEDLAEIKSVGDHPIGICTTIELDRDADQDKVHAQILDAINSYFSSEVKHYSLKEMLDKGYRTDEIFEGPLLEKGFIDTEELRDAELRSEVRLSDLVNIIMSIDGVKVIPEITIQDCKNSKDGKDWLICIEKLTKPSLAPTSEVPEGSTECDMRSVFNYKKDVIPVTYDLTNVEVYLQEIKDAKEEADAIAAANNILEVVQGEILDIVGTTTIQNDFPETYGIGPYGLPRTATTQRRSQAKQLKGYLVFFDQILSSYFAHLGKVKDLLSFNAGTGPTYFTQAVEDLAGFDDLVNDYPQNDDVLLSQKLMSLLDNNIERRNQFLDHLLARFAERFSEYSFLMKELYGASADQMIIQSKEQFLQEYVELSSGRDKGYECPNPSYWDTTNVSGVQKMVFRKTGIPNYNRRNLYRQNVIMNGGPVGPFKWSIEMDSVERIKGFTEFPDEADSYSELCFALHQLVNLDASLIESIDEVDVTTTGVSAGNVMFKAVVDGVGPYTFYPIDTTTDPIPATIELGESPAYATWAEVKTALYELSNYLMTDFVEEGMFLVEHILLRPEAGETNADAFMTICADDCKSGCAIDPYSFRVSVVLPGYGSRFSNPDFRSFMESVIQAEMPSHIIAKICWVGYRTEDKTDDHCQLGEFEEHWEAFLAMKQGNSYEIPTIQAINESIEHLHTIYPSGRLHDCENPDFSQSIILGRTNL